MADGDADALADALAAQAAAEAALEAELVQVAANDPADAVAGDVAALAALVEERTDDLLRVKAEFDNYRRRAEREYQAARTAGAAETLTLLLDVLDDIDRAETHGDLTGVLGQVAAAVRDAVGRAGLARIDAVGAPFDPRLHEAMLSTPGPVGEPTCSEQLRAGWQLGERVLRCALVAVQVPAPVEEQ